MIATASAILLGGCASTTRFVVARTEPAPLAGARRPALLVHDAPEHPGSGQQLGHALAERLRRAGLDPALGEAGPDHDAAVVVWLDVLAPESGRVHARAQVARPEWSTTLAKVDEDLTTAPALLDAVADDLARALFPPPRPVESVEWEDASPWDDDARAFMAMGAIEAALGAVERVLPRAKQAALDAETLSWLHYDLGLCLDLVGRTAEAERAFDEAVTLHGSERHLAALREVRRRREAR